MVKSDKKTKRRWERNIAHHGISLNESEPTSDIDALQTKAKESELHHLYSLAEDTPTVIHRPRGVPCLRIPSSSKEPVQTTSGSCRASHLLAHNPPSHDSGNMSRCFNGRRYIWVSRGYLESAEPTSI